MKHPWWHLAAGLVTATVMVAPAIAQQQPAQREPRIGYVLPAGGQRGTTFTVTVGGQFLDGVDGAYFTGKGIKATVVDRFVPINLGQAARLRDRLLELQAKRKQSYSPATQKAFATGPSTRPVFTAEDEQEAADLIRKLGDVVRKPSSPAIAESVTLSVEVAPDAEPGQRELRLITPRRMTNPMTFYVGYLPEVSEKPSRLRDDPTRSVPASDATITLPAVVNGQIMPGGIDRYHFTARKGQSLVIATKARALVPYIADAVPGWFQATLRLLDARGKELAYDDDYRFDPDPVLHYVIPEDGEYAIEIHDAIYRGREDFVYRIAIGELPFVTSIYPLGGRAGEKTEVELAGWNLPVSHIVAGGQPTGMHLLELPDAGLYAATASFAVDALPEVTEREPHDTLSTAQSLSWPVIANGRIGKPGEQDVYRFEGRAGQQIVAEVLARRLGSPLDSVLKLTDAAGKQLAFSDDQEDKAAGLETHHADSFLLTRLPADGAYYLFLGDTQGKGGPEYAYRLRLGEPRPDFELRVTPSSTMLRGWANTPLTAYVIRRDGFAGDVTVSVDNAPGIGLTSPVRILADQSEAKLNLFVRRTTADGLYPLQIQGRAMIGGRPVVHRAVPAEDMMQAFAYRHLVPAGELLATVARGVPAAANPGAGPAAKPRAAATQPSKR